MNGVNIVSWPGIFNQLMLMPPGTESFQVRIVPIGEIDEREWAFAGVHHALKEVLRDMGLTYDPNRLWRG